MIYFAAFVGGLITGGLIVAWGCYVTAENMPPGHTDQDWDGKTNP